MLEIIHREKDFVVVNKPYGWLSEYSATQENVPAAIAEALSLSPEQVGLKAGMLVIAIFPILGILVLGATIRYFKKNKQ